MVVMLGNSGILSQHSTDAASVAPCGQGGCDVVETNRNGKLTRSGLLWRRGLQRNAISGIHRLRGGLQGVEEMLWHESSSLEEMSGEDYSEDSLDEWGSLPPPDVVEKYEKLLEQGVDNLMKNVTAQLKQRSEEEKAGLPPPEERGEMPVQLVPEWEKKVLEKARRREQRMEARAKRLEERRKGIRPEPMQLNVNATVSVLRKGSLFEANGKVLQGELLRRPKLDA